MPKWVDVEKYCSDHTRMHVVEDRQEYLTATGG